MLLNLSGCTLAGLFSIIFMSSALPFLPHPRDPHPLLIPRASYSVVPVDGGAPSPTAGGSPGMTTTVIEIITQSPAIQNTLTIVSTEIVPAGTETLTSTTTITAQDTTKIYVVTVTPATATVTVTAVGQQTITVIPPVITELPSITAMSSITASTSTGESNSMSILTMTTATPSSVSSTTYDDGSWHTTYPMWSNSSSSTASRVVSSPTSLS